MLDEPTITVTCEKCGHVNFVSPMTEQAIDTSALQKPPVKRRVRKPKTEFEIISKKAILSPLDVAILLCQTAQTVRRRVKKGTLPKPLPCKGKDMLWKRDVIFEFIGLTPDGEARRAHPKRSQQPAAEPGG